MDDLLPAILKSLNGDVKTNWGMLIIAALLLVLGTKSVKAFFRMVDFVIFPVKQFYIHVNKWTGGYLGKFLWVGNCGLWLLGGMFVASFGFSSYRLNDIAYLTPSISYGLGWTGIGITVIACLAILRMWLRLEDPKKDEKSKTKHPVQNSAVKI